MNNVPCRNFLQARRNFVENPVEKFFLGVIIAGVNFGFVKVGGVLSWLNVKSNIAA